MPFSASISHSRPVSPSESPEAQPAHARITRLAGGLSLLLLVSLVMQLPALRSAAESSAVGRSTPASARLLSQATVVVSIRLSKEQRVQPAASPLPVTAIVATTPWAHSPSMDQARSRLAFWYLDLPPPLLAVAVKAAASVPQICA